MAAGKYRDRITVSRLNEDDDGYGNVTTAWEEIGKLWADVLEGLGKEAIASGRLDSPRTATIRLRSGVLSRSITEADKITVRGADWDIQGIAGVGRKGGVIEITCEEVTP